MSNRMLRVNELIQREMSSILRKRYQADAMDITLTGVEVSPDLHEGVIFVAVLGDAAAAERKLKWLRKHQQELRFELGRTIVLKHMPKFTFKLDLTTDRGNRILGLLDDLAQKEGTPPPPAEGKEPQA